MRVVVAFALMVSICAVCAILVADKVAQEQTRLWGYINKNLEGVF